MFGINKKRLESPFRLAGFVRNPTVTDVNL